MNDVIGRDAIRRTRFLVVDGDKSALENIDKILKAAGAPQVYVAPSPIVALRTLQDPHARVGCVICAHKRGTITGLQFLQSLRAGRWGSGIRGVKFILIMGNLDVPAVQAADAAGISGYFVGVLEPKAFIEDIGRVLASDRPESPLPKMQVAHINMSGTDFIFVPLGTGFAQASPGQQQNVVGELQTLMREQQLAGAVTPVWETANQGVGYFALPQYHATLATLTLDFVQNNLNRELTVLQPPPYVKLSSQGSAAYAKFLAAESGNDGALNLAGYEAPDVSPGAPHGPQTAPGRGVDGGSPSPAPSSSAEFGGPSRTPSRGVNGGPQRA